MLANFVPVLTTVCRQASLFFNPSRRKRELE